MPTRDVDPYDSTEVWRRLLAVVEWKGMSERAFCNMCAVNYNQWNNYKRRGMLPSRRSLELIANKIDVDYAFLRFGKEAVLRLDQVEILNILKRDQ